LQSGRRALSRIISAASAAFLFSWNVEVMQRRVYSLSETITRVFIIRSTSSNGVLKSLISISKNVDTSDTPV
jgi:hypothetical protein